MKTLYFIRHGKATHNEGFDSNGYKAFYDIKYKDSTLVSEGIKESKLLGDSWDIKDDIEIIFTSPLKRTLQTTMNIFEKSNIDIVALDELREFPSGLHWCNNRSNIDVLQKLFPVINFKNINSNTDNYWKHTRYETYEELDERINTFIQFIKKHDYSKIAVVGHCSFIARLLNKELDEIKHCIPYKYELI